MLRASALFVVIVISLLIGLLCSSLIFISYFQRLQVQKDLKVKRLELNAASGISLLLSVMDLVPYDEERIMDLYGEERDSVFLKRMHWGIFDVGIANAFSGNSSHAKVAQYGYKPAGFSASAIYLTDQNRPLSIAGNTVIKGDCYLPQSGIKKGYVEGQSFSGNELVTGKVQLSDKNLPAMSPKILDRLLLLMSGKKNHLPEYVELTALPAQDTTERSFLHPSLLVSSAGAMILDGKYFSGNIIFYSSKSITIRPGAKLDNVLLFAPYIKIEEGFSGRVQAFSSDSMLVEKACTFSYPSVLGLLKNTAQKGKQGFITIEEQTSLKGLVFTYSQVEDQEQTLVKIQKEAEVEGQVFVNGFIELYGRVHGNLSCNRFRLRTRSSAYDNHLWNASIDYSKRSPYFIGSELLTSEKERKVIAWLE